jgi:MFS family permease
VDRLPNRRLMIGGQVGQGACSLGIAVFEPGLAGILAFVVVLGVGTTVVRAAGNALVPAITGEDGATRGYAWISAGNSIGLLVGTAAGGILVATVGVRPALVIDALTYLVQTGTLLLVRAERRPHRRFDRHGPPAGRETRAGMAFMFGERVLLLAVVGAAVASFAATLVTVAEVFFVTTDLRGGAVLLGLLQGTWMVGLLAGNRFATMASSPRGVAVLLAAAECVMGFAFTWPAVAPVVLVTAAGYVVGGATNSVQNVCQVALIRAHTPPDLRGRAFAAAGAVVSCANVLGNMLGGVVVVAFGARLTFVLAAGLCLVAGLVSLRAFTRTPRVPPPITSTTDGNPAGSRTAPTAGSAGGR